MVIFHGYVSQNQRVLVTMAPWCAGDYRHIPSVFYISGAATGAAFTHVHQAESMQGGAPQTLCLLVYKPHELEIYHLYQP